MHQKLLLTTGLIATAVLVLFVQLSNPATIHPAGLLGFFVTMYILFLIITIGLLKFFTNIKILVQSKINSRLATKPHQILSGLYMYASVVALAPTMLVAMSSVGALGFMEVALVLLLEVLMLFYVQRRL